ncbi:LysR family transcriptional regulator [Brevibacillus choshinensis]|uniref:LysR family transcriptional regulator n=1 Tax=Brevibacillus choshinensis TaxID=54911 RepID=A0ABX7FLK3_BRECH|nr:LysR family transcriptional regulator [Brevibacillus choshinensis]QRG66720.1 LysR family transcriptional regulator [Brevibacillus choshinensis]
MDVRQLRYFIAVAEHLNFTEAARALFVAQPAVSQQIAHLEKSLGVQLFIRSKHSVELTHAGAIFLKDAREIVKRLEESIETVQLAEEGKVGNIKIGLLSVSVRTFLPLVVRAFRKKHPSIRIHFAFYNVGEMNHKLEKDEIDLAFTLSHGLGKLGSIASKKLWTQRYCVILPHDHPLAASPSLRLEQLAQEPFVMLDRAQSPQGYDHILSLCAKRGFSPDIVSHASRIDAVMLMVDAGIGITVQTKHVHLYATPTLRLIELEGEEYEVDVVTSWKEQTTNRSVALFLEEVELWLGNTVGAL